MPESNKTTIELGIEFVVELLLFLYPYGAEQMNLPHNFWLGLGCWVIGTAIAIRMFLIFPVWTHRLTRLEKGLIAFILVGAFVAAFYRPVMMAYGKRNTEIQPRSKPESNTQAEKPKEPEQQPEAKPIPATKPVKHRDVVKLNPIPIPSTSAPSATPLSGTQQCAPGAYCAQSSGQTGGVTAGQINLGPPPMEIKFSAESVTSTKSEFPYETKVTISTSRCLHTSFIGCCL